MSTEQRMNILLVSDQSFCLGYLIQSYFNLRAGHSKSLLEEFQKTGVPLQMTKGTVRLQLYVAPTKSQSTRLPMDEERTREYKSISGEIDIVFFCFYLNNSRTLNNIRGKYLDEIKQWFPKAKRYLIGLKIEEVIDNRRQYLRETISIQDRFLKKEMDVTKKDIKSLKKCIKAKTYYSCNILRKNDENLNFSEYVTENEKELVVLFETPVKLFYRKTSKKCVLL